MRETDAIGSATIIACSVQKAAVVENSSLIMGLGGGDGGAADGARTAGEEEEAAAPKGLHFVRFCPWAAVGRTAKKKRGRETKLSTPDKNVERKERRLAANTNTTYSYRRLEACLFDGMEGGVVEGGGRETDRPTTQTRCTTKFAKRSTLGL